MYGEVTSRNHQAYGWGHLVPNNIIAYIHVVCATSMRLCQFSDYFIKNSSNLFLKLGKRFREVIVTGREFQIFGPW